MEGCLDPVHITPEEFENATSVFLQSDQPSTLIRQENRVFLIRSSNRRNLKIQFLFLCCRPTIDTNPSRKWSFSKTLYKLEKFENSRFEFLWTET